MTSSNDALISILHKIRGASPDLLGGAVLDSAGAVLASDLDGALAARASGAIAEMSAAALSAGEAIWGARGGIVVLRAEAGALVIASLGEGQSLAVIAGSEARLGMLLLEVETRAREIRSLRAR